MEILTLDIGGTFIKYAKMNTELEILSKGKVDTPKTCREDLVNAIVSIYEKEKPVEGIAISMCGIIDCENGYVVMGGGQLPYNDGFHLRDAIQEKCPVKVYMENDAKAAAMAEATFGSLADVNDGFVLLFGTMIGGCFIKDHVVYHGKHFSAGEVSYIFDGSVDYPTRGNVWGNICSVPNLCKMYADKKGLNEDEVDGIKVFEAINNKDVDALNILDEFTRGIAIQIFNIQTVLDPEKIAIGGGISEQPIFIEYINSHLEKLFDNCMVNIPRAKVVQCKFKNDANLIGALGCYLKNC